MATCGYRTGVIEDASRPNWQNSGVRPIAWSAWYPSSTKKLIAQQTSQHFFEQGDVIWNGALVSQEILPVVLLSHGTGGTPESLGWLARTLASEGYVVLGANHHGNTGSEPYLAEGFLCWWERATDLSLLLSSIAQTGFFANRLELNRVSAIGFSLGSHSVLALLGARTSMEEFEAWRGTNNITESGPKEFPDAADSIPALKASSKAFRQSWSRHGCDFTDARIKSVVTIAPAPPVRSFTPQTIARIERPVVILTAGADTEASSEHCAEWLMAQNASFQRYDVGRHTGHYTFLDFPSDKSLVGKIDIFSDHEKVDRRKVHKETAERVLWALR